MLKQHPRLGRAVNPLPEEFREWVILFGRSRYIARYHCDSDNHVEILAIRHAREAGFKDLVH